MPKKIETLEVTAVKQISPEYCLLELTSAKPLGKIQPGQFAQLEVPGAKDVYLRRPLSISGAEGKTLNFLIKIIGKGTSTLAKLTKGQQVSVIFPLGNGFELIKKGNVLLVGGGCGIAPLFYLAEQLKQNKVKTTLLYGGKNKKDIIQLKELQKLAEVIITTDDGTLGTKGFVTDKMKKMDLKKYDLIYTCGPEIMMRNVYRQGVLNKVAVQASLEAMMGCGIGACLCCVTPTKKEGNVCICKEGPVFDPVRLQW